MSRKSIIPKRLAVVVLSILLVCVPTAAAAADGDKAAALAAVRESLTGELVAGWQHDPLFVDDIVRSAATKDQKRAIHRAIDDAGAHNVYVALLPEIPTEPGNPLMLSDTRPVMARLARDSVEKLGDESAIVILAFATERGRWEPDSYWVEDGAASASATSHFPDGVDTDFPAPVVSFSIRSADSVRAGEELPEPTDAEAPPLFSDSNLGYWMDPDGPNIVTLILTALALAGSVMLIRLRIRGGRDLTPTTLTNAQQRAAEKAKTDIRRIADAIIDTEPARADALDARDEIMRIDKAADNLISGRFPDDVRRSAAMIVLADDVRHAHGVVTGTGSGNQEKKNETRSRPEHCFFNPLHGRAAQIARWRGESREWLDVPACRACTKDLKNRSRPKSLTVRVGKKVRPYWALNDIVYARSGFGAFENLAETIVQADAESRATT